MLPAMPLRALMRYRGWQGKVVVKWWCDGDVAGRGRAFKSRGQRTWSRMQWC